MSKHTHPTKQQPSNLKPEWIRVPDATHISGLCRSTVYKLIQNGRIKSFSKCERGARRGVRLIAYDSLIDYLNEQYEAANKAVEK